MRRLISAAVLVVAACRSDYRYHTRAFVAPTPCGQGPYDLHVPADGTTGREGLEVIACTAHPLVGHVEATYDGLPLQAAQFGERADNARCLGGTPVSTTVGGSEHSPSRATGGAGGGAGPGAGLALVERSFHDDGAVFDDELCRSYGVPAQRLMTLTTFNADVAPGADLHVRIWSDVPNDLERTVFLIRHAVSTRTRAENQRDKETRDREAAQREAKARPASVGDRGAESRGRAPAPAYHGPPPLPLVEQAPPSPMPGATWIGGHWQWMGARWGWVGGFWRDDRWRAPAPQIEDPGAPPLEHAVWITGTWELRAGAWIWIRGRWR